MWHTSLKEAVNVCSRKRQMQSDDNVCLKWCVGAMKQLKQDELWANALFADLVGFYTHWTYIHIFLSNYWWQRSDIWSQASYRYPILWEAFLDPSDSYMKLVTKYQISAINSCWEKCDEKCAYMFNVYIKYQLSRQTGCRNLTGPKTLPTIWYTYDACDQISDFCLIDIITF
jgi:hypothetical protein